jgi:hypothetical protein
VTQDELDEIVQARTEGVQAANSALSQATRAFNEAKPLDGSRGLIGKLEESIAALAAKSKVRTGGWSLQRIESMRVCALWSPVSSNQ